MKEKLKNHIGIILATLFFIGGSIYSCTVRETYKELEDKIAVGQTWQYHKSGHLLYGDDEYYTKRVISTTHTFVGYIKNETDTIHELKYWFVINSTLIEE